MPTPRRPLIHACLRLALTFGLVAALVGLFPPAPVHAQTITVTTTAESPNGIGDCTLGEAIQAANTNLAVDACAAGTSDDTIVLAAGATYTLTSDFPNASAFYITSTITIEGNGATLARNPGGGPLRFFYVYDPGSLTLTDLTLRGGRVQGAQGTYGSGSHGGPGQSIDGGAVLHVGGTLTLDGVVFIDNAALGGHGGDGGYYPGYSFNGGKGGRARGGAIFSTGLLIITAQGAVFTGNRAAGGNGGRAGLGSGAGGPGGDGIGGALVASDPQFLPGADVQAEDNLAQGGDGGDGYSFPGGSGGPAFGGALYFEAETHVTLTQSRFDNNRAIGGSSQSFVDGTTSGGVASGGAIYSGGFVTLTYSTLQFNVALGGDSVGSGADGAGAIGGGILLNGTGPAAGLTLISTQFLSNTAIGGNSTLTSTLGGLASGAAIFVTGASLNMSASAVVSNSAIQGTNPNTTTVANATGGGLTVGSGRASITNTTFAHNTARQGGGLYNGLFGASVITLTHVTLFSNTAELGGGVYNNSNLWLTNSLVAYNAANNCAGPGSLTLLGANIQYPSSSCGAATSTDPLLGTLADHGGDTLTVSLLENSPATDLADPAYCPATDQRGVARPQGAACDLGAFEYEPMEELFYLWLPLVMR